MNRSLSAVLLPSLLVLSASAQEPSLPADFAALVPNDAVVLLELRSASELTAFVERIRVTAAPDEEPMSAATIIGGMLDAFGLPLDTAALDPNMPMGVTFAIDPQAPEPRPTFILPATDARALLASIELPPGSYHKASAGAYVALDLGEKQAAARGGSRLARGGPEGLVRARVDLGKLVDAFGPMIEMQLGQLEMMLDSGALQDPSMPFDMTDMFQWYLDLANDIVDSADLLDAAFDPTGQDLTALIELTNRGGSPLAGVGRDEPVDYRGALSRLDPEAPIQMVMRYDPSAYMDSIWGMYEGLFDAMEEDPELPDELAGALRVYLSKVRQMMELADGLTAASVDFGEGGVRMAATYHAQDPAALQRGWIELMSDPALAQVGLSTSAPESGELAGVQATSWTTRFDLKALLALAPADERPSTDEMAEIQRVVDALIGSQGLRMTALPQAERLDLVAGGDVGWRAAAAERLVKGGPLPAHLERAAAQLAGANPGWLMTFDLNRGMGRALELVSLFDEAADEAEKLAELLRGLGDRPIPCSMSWGVRGRVMSVGMSADLDGILQMVALTEARSERESQQQMARFELSLIEAAIERYAADHDGRLPESLEVLTAPNVAGEPYLAELPEDPWGRLYRYEKQDDGFVVSTLGADGQPGGEGPDADITSRDEPEEEGPGDAPFVYEIF